MKIFNDIFAFLETLTIVDFVFFSAVIILLILIVTLIYFIKINKNVFTEEDFWEANSNNKVEEKNEIENIIEEICNNVHPNEEDYDDEEGQLIDLDSLTKKLKEEEHERIDVTDYEKNQEEKAIISYEELLKHHNNYAINYESENILDDVVVKKINLNNLVNKNTKDIYRDEVRVVSYKKEEDFLNALKELNRLLN